MEKKKILLITVIIFVILAIAIFLLLRKDNNRIIPFVEENNIEILSAKDIYDNPVYIFTQDVNNNVIYLDNISFENSKATYNFYDYSVSNEDENGYVTFSFKYDQEVPIKYETNNTQSNWYYSFSSVPPLLFDYYTGEEYRVKNVSLDGKNIILYDENKSNNESNNDMKYTDISWDGNTYKIGVRAETTSEWEGNKIIEKQEDKILYGDISHSTTTVYVYAPKDYDGLMINILKRGSSKDSFEIQNNEYQEYLNLQKEEEETGEKSEKLIAIEEKRNKIIKLFESKYQENIKYNKDDFYVIRLTDISEKVQK